MNSINSFCGFSHSDKISKCSRFFSPTKSFTRVTSIHSDFWKIVLRSLTKYDMRYGVFVMEKVTITFSSRCDNVGLGCNFHSDNLQWTSMQYVYCEMLQKVVCNNFVCHCFATFTMLHVINKFWILQLKLLNEKQTPKLFSRLIPSYCIDITFQPLHCIQVSYAY